MGTVFDIQRCSYNDGPGIRTIVFFKGCQLRCAWCHNPESFRRKPQLQYIRHLCGGCGRCAQACPAGVHSFAENVHHINFERCTGCGLCAKQCPSHALNILGYEISAQEIIDIVLRDRVYYETSGGGMTISGGEPTTQPEFLLELLRLAKDNHIHTCLETNGYIPKELLDHLLDKVDLFLLDYKITGPQELYSYTRAAGPLWHSTLETLELRNIPVILRMPVIPGINDTPEHFREAASLKKTYSCIQRIEVMPYHSIGAAKWEQLGYDYALKSIPDATPEQKASWQAALDALY